MEKDPPAVSESSGLEAASVDSSPSDASGYTVVARRYRPKSFEELIGQDHIAAALSKAISSGRVGHAYLFTGARGVGKTSTARIFAKALNLGNADEATAAEIGAAIDSGEDMDVIEIDGASNRGIEEIRQLRANVNVRPSRSTYKIYIIDEVHMLTNQAFNALLKTLEEPPPHVKFIFCTTDPDKIPITVLSRCQRFDFAPVKLEAIQGRLAEICKCEGIEADDEALSLLARRAAGSMRDSQSLLEQVMSFSSERISVEQVHALLGTADESRLKAFAEAMIAHDALRCVQLVDESIRSGADAGQVAEQLLGYLRDLMAVAVGGGPDLLKLANPSSHSDLGELAEQFGMQTILNASQILDEALVRMRSSVSAVTLLEIALVQICQLEQIASIPALLESLNANSLRSAAQKKTADITAQPPGNTHAAAPSNQPTVVPGESKSGSASGSEVSGSAVGTMANVTSPSPSSAELGRPERADTHLKKESTLPGAGPSPSLSPRPSPSPSQVQQGAQPSGTQQNGTQQEAGNPNALVAEASRPAASGPVGDAGHMAVSATAVSTGASAGSTAATAPAAGASEAAPELSSGSSKGSPDCLRQWKAAASRIDGMLADYATMAIRVEPQGSDRWQIFFPDGAMQPKESCEKAENKAELMAALKATIGRDIALTFEAKPGEVRRPTVAISQSALRAQKLREMSNDPYVKKLCEVIGGEVLRVDLAPSSLPGKPKSDPAKAAKDAAAGGNAAGGNAAGGNAAGRNAAGGR